MSREIKKHYTNGEITILWQPALCIHCGVCVQGLPEVFHPQELPWITMERSTTDKIKDQVDQCPDGALTYTYVEEDKSQEMSKSDDSKASVKVVTNGPFIVQGEFDIEQDGKTTHESGPTTALCRCGASANKPYCDGAHKKVGFEG